ncbi:hypothetical protein L3X38_015717 [Prunus dulcis]|uniref:Uncharacterized protein n=1 Tax=Prunus dulcis TaxID=3755 RepID=A0AAD4W3W8_PRUDU|nr:hypothetical protein L3X38_015717 [Prunus dulcis]
MLFITRGRVLAYSSSNCGKCANSLEKGDFYGEELLDWVLKTCPAPTNGNQRQVVFCKQHGAAIKEKSPRLAKEGSLSATNHHAVSETQHK